jgi:uncharacterized protein YkwD
VRGLRGAASWISLAVLAAVLTVAPAANGAAHGRSARQACPTSLAFSPAVAQTKKAILCLHNLERRRHGLSQMRLSPELSAVALAHARDMVKRHYFSHFSPGGNDHMDRIAASAYPPSAGCWTAGENLLDADGAATPLQMLQAWMRSPEHRATILRRGWRDLGLGVVHSASDGNPSGLTIVALLGVRSKAVCG